MLPVQSAEQFAQTWGQDTAGAISSFLDGIGQGHRRAETPRRLWTTLGLADIRVADSNLRLGSLSEPSTRVGLAFAERKATLR